MGFLKNLFIMNTKIPDSVCQLRPEQIKKLEGVMPPIHDASIPKDYQETILAFQQICNELGIDMHDGILYHQYLKENPKILVIVGPSGAGKSTLVKYLMNTFATYFAPSISCTTRRPRGQEKDGEHYYFISQEEFAAKIAAKDFLEYEEVYNGIMYGTLISEVENIKNTKKIPLLDIDIAGCIRLSRKYPSQVHIVLIQPPDMNILEKRLRERDQDVSEFILQERIAKAEQETIQAKKIANVVIVNTSIIHIRKKITEVVCRTFNIK